MEANFDFWNYLPSEYFPPEIRPDVVKIIQEATPLEANRFDTTSLSTNNDKLLECLGRISHQGENFIENAISLLGTALLEKNGHDALELTKQILSINSVNPMKICVEIVKVVGVACAKNVDKIEDLLLYNITKEVSTVRLSYFLLVYLLMTLELVNNMKKTSSIAGLIENNDNVKMPNTEESRVNANDQTAATTIGNKFDASAEILPSVSDTDVLSNAHPKYETLQSIVGEVKNAIDLIGELKEDYRQQNVYHHISNRLGTLEWDLTTRYELFLLHENVKTMRHLLADIISNLNDEIVVAGTTVETKTKFTTAVVDLTTYINEHWYRLLLEFLVLLQTKDPVELCFFLFDNCSDAESIGSRYRHLKQLFDSDSSSGQALVALSDKEFVDMMSCLISQAKADVMRDTGADSPITKDNMINNYQDGQEQLQLAREMRQDDAIKKFAREATKHFRKAIHIADHLSQPQQQDHSSTSLDKSSTGVEKECNSWQEYIQNRIDYRCAISDALAISEHVIDAQVYIVSALFLAFDDNQPEEQVKKLYEKLHKLCPKASPAANPMLRGGRPQNTDRQRQAVIESHGRRLIQSTIEANGALVDYTSSNELIQEAKSQAWRTRMAGAGIAGTGALIVAAPLTGLALEYAAVVGTGVTLAALGPVGILLSTITMVGAVSCGVYVMSKGTSMMAEPSRRSLLNTIVTEAIECHKSKSFKQFFDKMGQSFDPSSKMERQYRVLRFTGKEEEEEMKPVKIAAKLFDHGFRADGVAYILNLIAEALLGYEEKLAAPYLPSRLQSMAVGFYCAIFQTRDEGSCGRLLADNACEHDTKVFEAHQARREKEIQQLHKEKIQPLTKTGNTDVFKSAVPHSHIEDAALAPFQARLEEICNVARINCAIVWVLGGDSYEREEAKKILSEVKLSVTEKYQYFAHNEERVGTIRDLMAVFDIMGDRVSDDQVELAAKSNSKEKTISWGSLLGTCNETIPITNELSFAQLLCDLGLVSRFYSNDELIRELGMRIEDGEKYRLKITEYIADGDGNMHPVEIIDETERSLLRNAHNLESIILQNGSTNPVQALKVLQRDFFPVWLEIVHIEFAQCRKDSLGENYIPYEKESVAFCHKDSRNKRAHLVYENNNLVSAFSCRSWVNLKNSEEVAFKMQYAEGKKKTALDLAARGAELKSLENWRLAQLEYKDALTSGKHIWSAFFFASGVISHDAQKKLIYIGSATKLTDQEVECACSYAECLIKLAKFREAMDFLNAIKHFGTVFNNNPKYWYLKTIAARKSGGWHLYEAAFSCHQLLSIAPHCDEYIREKKVIENLRNDPVIPTPAEYLRRKYHGINMELNHFATKSQDQYNIISIDGGGLRGILPAMWLAEIEKQAHRPIAHMANMLAGTSTGAIIAALLSTPKKNSSREHECAVTAAEMVGMYSNPRQTSRIFSKAGFFGGLFGAKYSVGGRASIVKEYASEFKMKDALIDLVVVASSNVNVSNPACVFSNLSSVPGYRDVSIFDAVMASSAAPTFFPSHEISSLGEDSIFSDGGIHTNNPTSVARDEALRAHADLHSKQVRIWSLGTGEYISKNTPSNLSLNQGAMYWAGKAIDTAIRAQVCATDEMLYNDKNFFNPSTNKNEYHRWQTWFDNPIRMDDNSDAAMFELVEYGRQFLEDNEEAVKRTVETLSQNFDIYK